MSDLQSLAEKFSRLDPVIALWIVREPADKDRPLPERWQFGTPADVRRNCLRELIAHDPDDRLLHFLLAARDAFVLEAFVGLAADAGRYFGAADDKTVAACCWLGKLFEPQPTVEEIAFGRTPWFVELANVTDKSIDRLRVEIPHADGPIGGGFRWNGEDHYGLNGKAEKLVGYLWSAAEKTATFDELAGPVWGDDAKAITANMVGKARTTAIKFFLDNTIPFEVSIADRSVNLFPTK